jgi:pimeloyl-ACP methyl ester carboxylesterase
MSLPDGIAAKTVETDRIRTQYHEGGTPGGQPVVLLHGNASSSRFYAEMMANLSDEYHALAPDFRGFGGSERQPIDATRGLRDFADDVNAFLAALNVSDASLFGWSTGGGVAMRCAIDYPETVGHLGLINPVSPYGFGGARRDGSPCQPDCAGTGGGLANEDFCARIENDDRGTESQSSPRNVLRMLYTAPSSEIPSGPEDDYVDAILDMEIGDGYYPGDSEPADHWPGMAPGERGVNNALSPKYCDVSDITEIESKQPVLWIRGSEDQVVADGSMLEAGYLGQLGQIPDWPGEEEYPPQPMVTQTRDVLEEYASNGGTYDEIVVDGAGHSPHIEQPESVVESVLDFLQ